MSKKQKKTDNVPEECHVTDWEKRIDFDKTIHIVFDTSVLEKTSYHKNYLQGALKTLMELGVIKIYIPTIVEKEHLSHINEKNKQSIACIKKALKEIKDGFLGDDKDIDRMNQLIADFSKRLEQQVQNKYQALMIKTLGAEVLDFKTSYQNSVFDGYFNSKLPFNQARNKEHIPDAFIFESIKDLYRQYNNMIVLVGDNQIRKACSEYQIVCLGDLITFIHCDEIQSKIKSKEIEKKIENFSIKLQDEDFREVLFDHLKQKIDLTFETLANSIFPEGEGEISMHDLPFGFHADFNSASNYGYGNIEIEVGFQVVAKLQTNVFKSDYFASPFGSLIEELNNNYVSVELNGDYLLRVNGDVVLNYSNWSEDDDNLFKIIDFSPNTIRMVGKVGEEDIKCCCSICHNIHYIQYGDLGEREFIESDDRGMDLERHWGLHSFFACEECGNDMEVNIDIWEYPEGCFNDISCSDCQGCQCEINRNNPLPFGLLLY